MTWMDRRLLPALACSLLLHTLPFLSDFVKPEAAARNRPPLEARLLPAPPAEQPPMMLPEPPKPTQAEAPPKPSKPPKPPKPEKRKAEKTPAPTAWVAEARRQIRELDKRGKLYPLEAIAQGLEGEAVVLFVLDESGSVVAARIEQSSGHKLLDDAALRAIYTLRSLPADAPREAVYPVRFRLH